MRGPDTDTARTAQLLARAIEGDAEAARLLEALQRERIVHFCLGYLGSRDEAEDAAQDVFLKLLAARTVPEQPRAWLYRVARNHCLNLRRDRAARGNRGPLPSDSQVAAGLSGVSTRLGARELRERVMRLVGELPAEHREPLRLRYAEGLSRREVAYVLDLPESVVKSRLFEGLERLRRSLEA